MANATDLEALSQLLPAALKGRKKLIYSLAMAVGLTGFVPALSASSCSGGFQCTASAGGNFRCTLPFTCVDNFTKTCSGGK